MVASPEGRKHYVRTHDGCVRQRKPVRDAVARSLHEILGCDGASSHGGIQGGAKQEQAWLHEPAQTAAEYGLLKDLIRRMMAYDPAQRLSPSAALSHAFFACPPAPKPIEYD